MLTLCLLDKQARVTACAFQPSARGFLEEVLWVSSLG